MWPHERVCGRLDFRTFLIPNSSFHIRKFYTHSSITLITSPVSGLGKKYVDL